MPSSVKPRPYDATRRRAAAEETRRRILAAAREMFTANGYEATAVSAIADRARVSVDTIYTVVGRKPQLLLAVHDMELAAADVPVTADERDYVERVRAAPTARAKIETYAAALAERLPRTVPLMIALREAGAKDPECSATYEALSQRRLANMRRLAAELMDTGETRPEVTEDEIAIIIWSMNAPDYFRLLVGQGVTPAEYAELLAAVWTRTFLVAD